MSLVASAPNGYKIDNYDPTEASVKEALDIADDVLTVEEATLYFGAYNADFKTPLNGGPSYKINDTAKAIVDGENNGSVARSAVFNAESVVANGAGADLTVAEAEVILALGNFAGTQSDVDISDSKSAIIGGGDQVLNNVGIDTVTVNDGPVGAYDGASINAFTAEVEFDVEATASELAMEVSGSGKVGDELDEADSVVVLSGGPCR